jgi:GntR family transcriptional regulator
LCGVRFAIDADSPEYPYVQLAALLRAGIASGEIRPRVPSITELAEETGLATGTVRRALAILKDEGLIEAVPGRGSFVAER